MRIHRERKNRMQKAEDRRVRIANVTQGEGLYLFRNSTKGDLQLLKPSLEGKKYVAPGEEFRGDSYFITHVKNHEAILVDVIRGPESKPEPEPEPEPESKSKSEPESKPKSKPKSKSKSVKKSKPKTILEQKEPDMEEKLILDQPDCITPQGKTEQVVVDPKKKLNEVVPEDNPKDVLLTEDPLDGVEIITD